MKIAVFLSFVLGVAVALTIANETDKGLPKAITIERGGKAVGFADMKVEDAKYITIKDGDNPGIFLGFPIYKEKYS